MEGHADIHELYALYNALYFDGALGACSVQWSSPRMTLCAGTCEFERGGARRAPQRRATGTTAARRRVATWPRRVRRRLQDQAERPHTPVPLQPRPEGDAPSRGASRTHIPGSGRRRRRRRCTLHVRTDDPRAYFPHVRWPRYRSRWSRSGVLVSHEVSARRTRRRIPLRCRRASATEAAVTRRARAAASTARLRLAPTRRRRLAATTSASTTRSQTRLKCTACTHGFARVAATRCGGL